MGLRLEGTTADGTRTVHLMPPSDESEGEELLDKREVLVNILKAAIPSGFRKEGIEQDVAVGKWKQLGKETASAAEDLSTEVRRNRTVECKPLSTGAMLRRLERERGKDADQRIAEMKAQGTQWWLSSLEAKAPPGWLDMPACEITDDVKRDLEVLSLRGVFNPSKHYRNMDRLEGASWLQIGTVMDHPLDGRKGRLPNRLRKRTLTQQWMADPEMGDELRKRYAHHQEEEGKMEHLRSKQYPLMTRRHRKKRHVTSS